MREEHFGFLDGSSQPKSYNEKKIHALLIHENTHSERMLEHGIFYCWWWIQKYRYSRSFRVAEEFEACQAEFEKLVEYGIPIPFEHCARALSGPIYSYMISFEDALSWVRSTVTSLGDVEYAIQCLDYDQWLRRMDQMPGDDDATKAASEPRPCRQDAYWIVDRIALVACGAMSFIAVELVTIAVLVFAGS